MSRNILLGYSGSLVGVPPSPRPTACASGRTRLSAWLCAPCGRFLLHIRAGEGRRNLRVSVTRERLNFVRLLNVAIVFLIDFQVSVHELQVVVFILSKRLQQCGDLAADFAFLPFG